MAHDLKNALKTRRTRYGISNSTSISDEEIKKILDFAVTHVPSAFNSQSTRIVLLLGNMHKRLWEITKEELKKIIPEKNFKATEDKINNSFAAGYGTILFYEDTETVEGLQNSFPGYKDNFPIWSQHTSGMHQFAIWTLLAESGLGASLQHYNPLIDNAVAKEWNINSKWKLIAQMPFGIPIQPPAEKTFKSLEERIFVYK